MSKDDNQYMDDYFLHIKRIVDSLTSIELPVSDLDLVILTLNGPDEDYFSLATSLLYGSNLLTFDDLRGKLIHYEQCLKFLKTKDHLVLQHPASAATTSSVGASQSTGKQSQNFSSNHNN